MDLRVVDGRRYLTLSWSDIEVLIDKLAEQISSIYEPNMLIGILRGGAIVASMLSDVLDMREVYTIGCRSYTGVEERETVVIYQPLSLNSLWDKNVLIVDDVVDTGETMKHIVQHIKGFNPRNVKTATLHIKPHTSFVPDFYVENVNAWIVYPWSTNEFVRNLASEMVPRLGISRTFEEIKKIVSNIDVIRRNLPSEKIKDRER
ncbi:MAG: phosphoribosyltransferase [Nitrososphaerota archaeon]